MAAILSLVSSLAVAQKLDDVYSRALCGKKACSIGRPATLQAHPDFAIVEVKKTDNSCTEIGECGYDPTGTWLIKSKGNAPIACAHLTPVEEDLEPTKITVNVKANRATVIEPRTRCSGTTRVQRKIWPSELIQLSRSFEEGACPFDIESYVMDWVPSKSLMTLSGRHPHLVIPSFDQEIWPNWETKQLGNCGLNVSGAPSHGYSLLKPTEYLNGASFTAAVFNDSLLVQVIDQAFVTGSPNWINDDHLELWISSREKDSIKLWQWGIRLDDAKVFPAFGHPKIRLPIQTARFQSPDGKRWKSFLVKLTGLSMFDGLTISYSLSDGGKRVKALLATSPMKFGNATTLGGVFRSTGIKFKCVVSQGVSQVRVTDGGRPTEGTCKQLDYSED